MNQYKRLVEGELIQDENLKFNLRIFEMGPKLPPTIIAVKQKDDKLELTPFINSLVRIHGELSSTCIVADWIAKVLPEQE